MSHAKRLSKASGLLFLSGFLLSKLQYLPYPLISAGFRFFSLALSLAAYGTWFAASYLQKGHNPLPDKWYGFAEIKKQFIFASFIGFCATVLSIAAVFVPILFPPAAWLFAIGNTIWAIGELHKSNNPQPDGKAFSPEQQQAYFGYAATSTAISVVGALAATFILFFPLFTLPITIFSILICVGLGMLAIDFWLDSNFGEHKPAVIPGSYSKMDDLGSSHSPSVELTQIPAPHQSSKLFANTETDSQPKNTIETLQRDSQFNHSTL